MMLNVCFWHLADIEELPAGESLLLIGCFGVKRFGLSQLSAMSRGLVLLFRIGPGPPIRDPRTVEQSKALNGRVQADMQTRHNPSSTRIHHSTARWSSVFSYV